MSSQETGGNGLEGYKGLLVYEKSYKSALKMYEDTRSMPKEELYGITSQIRRSAASIPANIAEGYAKKESPEEYRRYLIIAKGSCYESKVWIDMCSDLGYMSREWQKEMLERYDEIAKMLYRLINPK